MSDGFGIYVHIPFCRRKCGYCDFQSVPLSQTGQSTVPRTIDQLCAEIAAHRSLVEAIGVDLGKVRLPEVTSIYIGGGTPSVVPSSGIQSIISAVRKSFILVDGVEVTVEVNPETASQDWLQVVFDAGANRISIGVQSMDDGVLDTLGRPHGASDVENAVKVARAVGFEHLSLDLIYGAPEETLESWEQTIDAALRLEPEHYSVYGLTLSTDVPMGAELGCRHGSIGAWEVANEDTLLAKHDLAGRRLEAAGYPRYELCSYGSEGHRSRHNLNYWAQGGYLGFGPGAHSHLPSGITGLEGARRWCDGRSVEEYAAGTGSQIADMDVVSGVAAQSEMVFLALRMKEGLDLIEYRARFNSEFSDDFSKPYSRLVEEQLLTADNGRVYLTAEGWPLADHVMGQFI